MSHHRRGRPKSARAGCLMCKPNKKNGVSRTNLYWHGPRPGVALREIHADLTLAEGIIAYETMAPGERQGGEGQCMDCGGLSCGLCEPCDHEWGPSRRDPVRWLGCQRCGLDKRDHDRQAREREAEAQAAAPLTWRLELCAS